MPVYKVQRTLVKIFDQANPAAGVQFYSNTDQTLNGFQLNTLPNYTELTNLYDQYRIVCVEVRFIPSVTTALTGASVDNLLPRIATVADFNDGSLPTNLTSLQQYQSYRADLFNKVITRKIYPRTATAIYNNGATSGYAFNDQPTWVDTANPGVQHYGMKWAMVWPVAGTGTSVTKFTVEFVHHLEFRCVN